MFIMDIVSSKHYKGDLNYLEYGCTLNELLKIKQYVSMKEDMEYAFNKDEAEKLDNLRK